MKIYFLLLLKRSCPKSVLGAKNKISGLSGDDTREGLVAIISVQLSDPQFEGQTKMKLGNSEVKGLVQTMVGENLREFFEENPGTINSVSMPNTSRTDTWMSGSISGRLDSGGLDVILCSKIKSADCTGPPVATACPV